MSAKRRVDTHVPRITEVINASADDSSHPRIPSKNATEPVTLASLASDLEDVKGQIAIMVEWLETLDERTGNED